MPVSDGINLYYTQSEIDQKIEEAAKEAWHDGYEEGRESVSDSDYWARED